MDDVQKLILSILSTSLFSGDVPEVDASNIAQLLEESKSQAVFSLVFAALETQVKEKLSDDVYNKYSELYFSYLLSTARIYSEHEELHKVMINNDISYAVIKGIASSKYYKVPLLRCAGDVDILVHDSDFLRACSILEDIGLAKNDDNSDIHIAFNRPPSSIWELHKTVNGIPNNDIGKEILAEIENTTVSSELNETEGIICRAPDVFHHGLIMLLHTAAHLTSEGIGLRHLCDWVVFVCALSDKEFVDLFEEKLKRFGLWYFAQVLTLIGIKYLKAPVREWATKEKAISEELLEDLIEDILTGGNFGKKDMNRYREIKYITDRERGTIEQGGVLSQGLKSLNQKVFERYKFISKYRVLLPLGWVIEITKYIGLLFAGKRKATGTSKMLKEAKSRKKIYSSLKLFEIN